MKENELAESVKALTECLYKIHDNGCLFDKLVAHLGKLTGELNEVSYWIKHLSNNIENR